MARRRLTPELEEEVREIALRSQESAEVQMIALLTDTLVSMLPNHLRPYQRPRHFFTALETYNGRLPFIRPGDVLPIEDGGAWKKAQAAIRRRRFEGTKTI